MYGARHSPTLSLVCLLLYRTSHWATMLARARHRRPGVYATRTSGWMIPMLSHPPTIGPQTLSGERARRRSRALRGEWGRAGKHGQGKDFRRREEGRIFYVYGTQPRPCSNSINRPIGWLFKELFSSSVEFCTGKRRHESTKSLTCPRFRRITADQDSDPHSEGADGYDHHDRWQAKADDQTAHRPGSQ